MYERLREFRKYVFWDVRFFCALIVLSSIWHFIITGRVFGLRELANPSKYETSLWVGAIILILLFDLTHIKDRKGCADDGGC